MDEFNSITENDMQKEEEASVLLNETEETPKPAAAPADSYDRVVTSDGYGTYFNPPGVNQDYSINLGNGVPNTSHVPKETKPKKHSKAAVAIIVIIAIIIGAVGFGGLYLSSKPELFGSLPQSETTTLKQSGDKTDNTNSSENAAAKISDSSSVATTDEEGNLTVAGVVQKSKDSCVGISVYTAQDEYSYFYNYGSTESNSKGETLSGEGSGVIMSEDNGKTYIMTCAHVISDGSSFKVTLDDDTEYDAQMVGYDSKTDIGVLVIDAKGLAVAEFGNSKNILVGEDCVAIGCPGGLQFKNSVTKGVVSALDVPVSSSIGYNNECIQVDAAINPGNSGGALFNMQGQVIGINSSKIASTEYEGMGFAVPSNTAVETANSLIKNGYVAGRAMLGITYKTLENYSSASTILAELALQGYRDANGTMVIQEIRDDSDLKGKVQEYDMIVAVNGDTLTSVDILTSVLSNSKPGDKVKLTIARIDKNNIETFEVECTLIEAKE